MILVDSRQGSEDLTEPLRRMGLDAQTTTLPFGDLCFEGKGNGTDIVDVGIELKKVHTGDLESSLRSGRLSGHQLPGLVGPKGAYEYAWLIVEGQWRTDSAGKVVIYKGPKKGWQPLHSQMTTQELERRLLTLEMCGGLHVRCTNTRRDTLQFIAHLYRWFRDKPLDGHGSHLEVHTPHSFLQVSDFRAAVQRYPGIGPRMSLAVEKEFKGSLLEAAQATAERWSRIATVDKSGKQKKLGLATATKVYQFIRGIK